MDTKKILLFLVKCMYQKVLNTMKSRAVTIIIIYIHNNEIKKEILILLGYFRVPDPISIHTLLHYNPEKLKCKKNFKKNIKKQKP